MARVNNGEMKALSIYFITYLWNKEWRKGIGVLNNEGYVNIITADGGVMNVCEEDFNEIRVHKEVSGKWKNFLKEEDL